jgi:hypothetical protein
VNGVYLFGTAKMLTKIVNCKICVLKIDYNLVIKLIMSIKIPTPLRSKGRQIRHFYCFINLHPHIGICFHIPKLYRIEFSFTYFPNFLKLSWEILETLIYYFLIFNFFWKKIFPDFLFLKNFFWIDKSTFLHSILKLWKQQAEEMSSSSTNICISVFLFGFCLAYPWKPDRPDSG